MNFQKTKLAIIAGLLLISTHSWAQSPWINNNNPGFITFEFSKPSFGGNDGLSFFSAAYDLSGGFALGEKSELIFDLPIGYFKTSNDFFGVDSETSLGNLYVGVRTGDRSKNLRGEFGAYLPTSPDDKPLASLIGIYALPNREEKFAPNFWGLSAKAVTEKVINDKGAYYRFRGGLLYLNNSDADITAMYLDYGGQVGLRADTGVGIFAAVSGRTGLGDDSKYAEDDSSSFLFALGLSYRSKNFEPGVTLNLPLDEPYKQLIDNVINVSFLFHLQE